MGLSRPGAWQPGSQGPVVTWSRKGLESVLLLFPPPVGVCRISSPFNGTSPPGAPVPCPGGGATGKTSGLWGIVPTPDCNSMLCT